MDLPPPQLGRVQSGPLKLFHWYPILNFQMYFKATLNQRNQQPPQQMDWHDHVAATSHMPTQSWTLPRKIRPDWNQMCTFRMKVNVWNWWLSSIIRVNFHMTGWKSVNYIQILFATRYVTMMTRTTTILIKTMSPITILTNFPNLTQLTALSTVEVSLWANRFAHLSLKNNMKQKKASIF